jgi:hypothetical protein
MQQASRRSVENDKQVHVCEVLRKWRAKRLVMSPTGDSFISTVNAQLGSFSKVDR